MSSRTILHQKNPRLPFESSVNVATRTSNFKVHVTGDVASSPHQYAIEVKEGQNTLFHFNPRWSESRTVMNSYSAERGWGKEENAFFASLVPNTPFDVTITSEQDKFYVQVNHDPVVQYFVRIPTSGVQRTVTINKVEHNDVSVSLVEVTTSY